MGEKPRILAVNWGSLTIWSFHCVYVHGPDLIVIERMY